MMNKIPKIWVLTDNRAGNSKQAVALAEILGFPYKVKKLKYTFLAKLPNFLKVGFMGIAKESMKNLRGKPDIVISAGRRTASVALAIKKKTGAKILQIMHPGLSLHNVDVLILPHHDRKPKDKHLTKTIFVHGALTHTDSDFIKDQASMWEEKFSYLPKPHIAVLLGGKSKNTNFTKINAKALVRLLLRMASKTGGSLLITSSRRTPKPSLDVMENALLAQQDIPFFIHDFYEESAINPYFALLGIADEIVVTGDSVSMCSEAVQTMKPVYVFAEANMIGKKHKKYIDYLFQKGVASPLFENHKSFNPKASSSNLALKNRIMAVLKSL